MAPGVRCGVVNRVSDYAITSTQHTRKAGSRLRGAYSRHRIRHASRRVGAEEFLGLLFKFFRTIEAQGGVNDDALFVHPYVGRDARHTIGRADIPPVQKQPVFQLVFPGERGDGLFGFIPRIDAENDQALIAVFVGKLTEVRSLRTTGRSPRGPKSQ